MALCYTFLCSNLESLQVAIPEDYWLLSFAKKPIIFWLVLKIRKQHFTNAQSYVSFSSVHFGTLIQEDQSKKVSKATLNRSTQHISHFSPLYFVLILPQTHWHTHLFCWLVCVCVKACCRVTHWSDTSFIFKLAAWSILLSLPPLWSMVHFVKPLCGYWEISDVKAVGKCFQAARWQWPPEHAGGTKQKTRDE